MMWSSSCCSVLMSVILSSPPVPLSLRRGGTPNRTAPQVHEAPGRPDHGVETIRSTSRVLLHLHRRRRCRTQYAHARRQMARAGTACRAQPRYGAAWAGRWNNESFGPRPFRIVIREAASIKLMNRYGAGQAEDSRSSPYRSSHGEIEQRGPPQAVERCPVAAQRLDILEQRLVLFGLGNVKVVDRNSADHVAIVRHLESLRGDAVRLRDEQNVTAGPGPLRRGAAGRARGPAGGGRRGGGGAPPDRLRRPAPPPAGAPPPPGHSHAAPVAPTRGPCGSGATRARSAAGRSPRSCRPRTARCSGGTACRSPQRSSRRFRARRERRTHRRTAWQFAAPRPPSPRGTLVRPARRAPHPPDRSTRRC